MIAVMALCSAAAQMAGKKGSPSVDEQLKKLDQKWLDAEKLGDADFLDKLFSDDYEMVNTQGDGLTKEEMLAKAKSPTRDKLDILRPDEIQVHVYGNLAIINDHTTITGHTRDGQELNGLIYSTRILVKKNGKWRAVHEQETWMKAPSGQL